MSSGRTSCALCERREPDEDARLQLPTAREAGTASATCGLLSVCPVCIAELREIKVLKERVKYLEDEVCRLNLAVGELRGDRCATSGHGYTSASPSTGQRLLTDLRDPGRADTAAVGFDDGSIGVVSLGTGKLERYMSDAHEDAIGCVVAAHGGAQVVSSSDDGTLAVWETTEGERVHSMDHCAGRCIMEGRSVFSAAAFEDGRIASGAEDRLVKLWGPQGDFLFSLPGHSGAVYFCTVVHSSCLATCSSDATIRVWDISPQGGTCTHVLQGHHGTVYCAAVCNGARLVSASHDATLKLWGLAEGTCEATLTGHLAPVLAVAVLKGGDAAVSSSADCTVRLWSLKSRECLRVLEGHTDPVRSLTILPHDEHILSCADDATLRIWRTDGECIRTIACPKTPCSVALLPSL